MTGSFLNYLCVEVDFSKKPGGMATVFLRAATGQREACLPGALP
jgi:hypothetical protein